MNSNPSSQSNKIVHIEALRGLAAFSVVLTHIRDDFFNDHTVLFQEMVGSNPLMTSLYGSLSFFFFHSGGLSVYLFWVLSGFVLPLRYLNNRFRLGGDGLQSIMRVAYISRYFRLFLPVSAVCFLVYLFAHAGFLRNEELTHVLGKTVTDTHKYYIGFTPSFLETLKFAFWDCPFLLRSHFNPPLWTISYELWGSLLLYSVLCLVGTHHRRFIVYGVVLLILLFMESNFSGFIIGLCLADIKTSGTLYQLISEAKKLKKALVIVLGLYVLMIWTGHSVLDKIYHFFFSSILRLDAVFSSAAVVFIVECCSSRLRRALSWKPLVFLGRSSFGIYLLHQPILCSLGASVFLYVHQQLDSRWIGTLAAATAAVPTILFCGWLFHMYIDQPAVRASKRLGKYFA